MYLPCHKFSLHFFAGADSGRAGHLCARGQLGDPGVHRGGVLQPCLHCLAVQPGGRSRQSTLRTGYVQYTVKRLVLGTDPDRNRALEETPRS
jgi:hypothetical protein